MTIADLAYHLERSEDCTAQSLRALAATLSPSRAEMLERCAIVAGLYPLPASSCSWNFAATDDADEEGLSFTGYGPAQASPRRCRVKRKPNMFVTRARKLPPCAVRGIVRTWIDNVVGSWHVSVSTTSGTAEASERVRG